LWPNLHLGVEWRLRRRAFELILVASLLAAAVLTAQLCAGVYASEFGDDEASHYISGLLIHDYLVRGLFQSPLQYLKDFHSHYPLVGIGHWPPLYYLVEGLWMGLFSTGRVSVLALSAAVTVATALAAYLLIRRRVGPVLALFVALAFVASPVVQSASGELMLDIPVAFLCLAAAWCYARYLETCHFRAAAAFGFLAGAALLVKGNAACLALLPPLAVLIGRRFEILRRGSFWLPIPIVATIAGPWYVATYGLVEQGFRFDWGLKFIASATIANAEYLLSAVGPLVLVAAFLGLLDVVAMPRNHAGRNELTSISALFVSVLIFQSVVPAALQDRYLIPALPPFLMLAAWGISAGSERIANRWSSGPGFLRNSTILTSGGALALSVSVLGGAMHVEQKPQLGLTEAARQIWAHRIAENPAVLIVSDGHAEAALIAELAMADPQRPSLFSVRGSRLLGAGGYNNQEYLPRFHTSAEVMAAIDEYKIPFVLFRPSAGRQPWAHIEQVANAASAYASRWETTFEEAKTSPKVVLYEISGNDLQSADQAKLTALSAPRSLAR